MWTAHIKSMTAVAALLGITFGSRAAVVVTEKPIPDVDKPIKIVTTPQSWDIEVDPDHKYTCGTAGLANKLWGAGYRVAPKTWVKEGGKVTSFKPVATAQEMFDALLQWVGRYAADNTNEAIRNKYKALGLAGQEQCGNNLIKDLRELSPGEVKRYQVFTHVVNKTGNTHSIMTEKHLKAAVKLFEQCQFLELGALADGAGHVVSVKRLTVTRDDDGNITSVEAGIHDSSSDVVDATKNPPVFAGDEERYDLFVENGQWKMRSKDRTDTYPIKYYKVFCPPSVKVDKAVGSKSNPTASYDPATKTLSFSTAAVNILDDQGGLSGGIDPAYANDPIRGATIRVSNLVMMDGAPDEDYPEVFTPDESFGGFTFEGGMLTIEKDGSTLLEASFPFFRIIDGFDATVADSYGIITDLRIENSIHSAFLDALAVDAADASNVFDFYAEASGFANLADAFGRFAGAGSGRDGPIEVSIMLAKNGDVPEPGAISVLCALLLARRRGTASS